MNVAEISALPVTGQNAGLGMHLTCSAFRRGAHHGPWDWWRDAAYCLDAPCVLPGGSMVWDQVDDDLAIPAQTMVPR